MKKKGKTLLLISMIIGIAYLIYSFYYWGGANASTAASDTEAIGTGLATVIVMPHLILTGIAVIFNVLAFFLYNRPFALVAGILYTVALAVFPPYFMFVIIEMILCYIAFAKMKKNES